MRYIKDINPMIETFMESFIKDCRVWYVVAINDKVALGRNVVCKTAIN